MTKMLQRMRSWPLTRIDVQIALIFPGRISNCGQNMILANEETLLAEEIESKILFQQGLTVILSACNGARQKVGTRGQTSVARACLASGASCVVGALWKAGDQETFGLMRLMYAFLMAGLSVARAQRLAILDSVVYQHHRTKRFCQKRDLARGVQTRDQAHRSKGGGKVCDHF